MEEFYLTSLHMHRYFALFLLILACIHFLLVSFGVETKNYVRRIRLFLPLYYTFFAFLLASGLNVYAYFHFALNYKALYMVLILLILIGLGVFEYKKLKTNARLKTLPNFAKIAKKKIILEILLIISCFVI